MKDLSSRDWVWKWLFRRQGFLDQKSALFSPETFKISWPSQPPSIHRQWLLPIWFQVSWHHTLKYSFSMIKIKNIKIDCRCIHSSCLPWDLIFIQHRSWLGTLNLMTNAKTLLFHSTRDIFHCHIYISLAHIYPFRLAEILK